MKRFLFAPFLALVLLLAPARAGEIGQKAYPGERTGTTLENEHLRIGVIPEIGGRIVELTAKETGNNYLHRAPWYFSLGKEDKWQGAEYGGIIDAATDGWPGPFWGEHYAVDPLSVEDGVALRAEAEAEGIAVVRDMILPNGESRLIVKVVQTNAGEKAKGMIVRIHGEFRVGEMADEADVIFWHEGGRLRERHFVRGSESPRFFYDHPDEPWMAMVDTASHEALIHVFREPGPPYRVMFWSGHPAQDPEKDENTGTYAFYNNERFGTKTLVKPGAAKEAVEEFWVVLGLGRVDAWCEAGVAELALPKLRFGPDEPIEAVLRFGGPVDGAALEAKARLLDTADKPLDEAAATLPAFEAGEAAEAKLSLDLAGAADGTYRVVADFSRDGETLCTATRTLAVVGALVEDATSALATTRAKAMRFVQSLSDDHPSRYAWKGIVSTAIEEMEDDYAAGNYESVLDESKRLMERIGLMEESLRRREEAVKKVKPALDPILKRWRGN